MLGSGQEGIPATSGGDCMLIEKRNYKTGGRTKVII